MLVISSSREGGPNKFIWVLEKWEKALSLEMLLPIIVDHLGLWTGREAYKWVHPSQLDWRPEDLEEATGSRSSVEFEWSKRHFRHTLDSAWRKDDLLLLAPFTSTSLLCTLPISCKPAWLHLICLIHVYQRSPPWSGTRCLLSFKWYWD